MSAEPVLHADPSALVKLVVEEAEPVAPIRALAGRGRREPCARPGLPRAGAEPRPRGDPPCSGDLDTVDLVRLDDAPLDEAASLQRVVRGAPYAIHVPAAPPFGALPEALVTHDRRIAAAGGFARAAGREPSLGRAGERVAFPGRPPHDGRGGRRVTSPACGSRSTTGRGASSWRSGPTPWRGRGSWSCACARAASAAAT